MNKSVFISGALKVSEFFGAALGALLRPLSSDIKCSIVRACGFLRDRLPHLLWSVARPGMYAGLRALYSRTGQHCVVTRTLAPGVLMDLDISQKTQRRIYTERAYEASVVSYFAETIQPGDGFIDVGANVGYYTLLASHWVGLQGVVHAFEPEQQNFTRLQTQIARNKLSNVVTHHAAAGAKPGRLTLNLNPLNEGGHSLKPFDAYFDDGRAQSKEHIQKEFSEQTLSQEVEVVALSETLANDGRQWHMKVDVEGAELEALQGARSFIMEARPDICCEISGDTPELRGLLENLQYEVYNLRSGGLLEKALTLSPGNYILKPINK